MIYHWLRQYRLNKQLIGIDRVLSFKVPTLDHWNHPRDTRDTADWLAVNICKHIWNEFKLYCFRVVFYFLIFYHSLSLHGLSFSVLLCLLSYLQLPGWPGFPAAISSADGSPRRPGLDSSSATATAMVKSRNGFGWTNRTQTEAKQKQST